MKHILHIFISVALLSPVVAGYPIGLSQDLFKGRLFKSFFYSYIPEYGASKIDTAHLPGDIQDRVEEYKRRNRRFRSLARSCKNLQGIELANCDKQLAVEKAIVSLNRRPATVLEPYLLLFLVHRYRCAYECLEFEKKFKEQQESAAKYKYYLQKSHEHSDKLVGLIAADIDMQPYLYIRTKNHP